MAIKNEIVDELLKDVDPKKVFSSEGLLSDIKKALAERMLNAELDDHLQNEAAAVGTGNEPAGNHRNGYTKKTCHHRYQPGGAGDSARSARYVRAAADCQVSAALPGFRRQDHLHVRPRHEHARHPGACARALRY